MVSNRPPSVVAFAFLAAFAAWFVADRYVGVAFYRLIAGEAVESSMAVMIMTGLAAVIGASLTRSWRRRGLEWMPLTMTLASLCVAELAWRLIIAPLPFNGFKLVAAIMDVGTPFVAVLGLAAALAEWRDWINYEQRSGPAGA